MGSFKNWVHLIAPILQKKVPNILMMSLTLLWVLLKLKLCKQNKIAVYAYDKFTLFIFLNMKIFISEIKQ